MTYYIAAAWLCCAIANAGLLRERDRTLSAFVAFTFALVITALWPIVALKVLGDWAEKRGAQRAHRKAREAYAKAAAKVAPGRFDA